MKKISTVGIVSMSVIAILLISAIGNVAAALPGVTAMEVEGDTTDNVDARPCDFQIFGDVQHPAIDSVEEICVIDAIQGTRFELVGLNDDLNQILIDYAQNNYTILVYGKRRAVDQIEVSALVDAYNKWPLVYIKDYTNHSYDFYINPIKAGYRTRIWLNDGVTYMEGETVHQVWKYFCVNLSGGYRNREETFRFEKMVGYDTNTNDEDNNYINITEITQQLNYSSYECFTPGRDYRLKRFVSGANGPQLDEHSTNIARQSEPFHIDIGNSTDPYRTISVTQDPEGSWTSDGGWIHCLCFHVGNVSDVIPDPMNMSCDFQIFGEVQHPAIDSVEEICVIDAIQGTRFELLGLNDDLNQILIDYAQNNYTILVYGNRSSFDQIEVSALVDTYNKRPLVYIKDYTNHSYDFYINPYSEYRTRIWLNDGVTYMEGETAHQVWKYYCVNLSGGYRDLEETFRFEKMVGYDTNDEDNNYINITEITQQLNYSTYECFTPGRDYWLKRFVSGANGPQLRDEHSTNIARQSEPFHIDIGNSTDPYRTISVTQDPEGSWKWTGGWIHCLTFQVENVSDVIPDPMNMSCDFQIFGLVQHPAIDSVEEICVIDAIQGTPFELVGLNDDLNQILIEYAQNNYRLIVYGKRSSDDRINVSALVDSIVNPRVYIKDQRNHSYDFHINPSPEYRTRMWLKDGVTSMAGETVHRVIYENLTCGYEDLEETFIFGKKKGYNTSIMDTHVPYEAGYTKITEITHQLNYSSCECFTQGRDYWLRPFAMGANGLYLSEDCSDIARQSEPFRIEIANSTDHYRTVAVNQVMEGTSWLMNGGWIHCLCFHVGRGFTDVASVYGVNDSHQGRATVWFDYDNDGDLDLLITVSKGNYTILYRNDGDTFVDVAEEVGLSAIIGGLSVGDYDNDGDLDILCGWLFRNDIDTTDTFTEVGSYGASLFVDYDNDGDLDIYQTRFWESNKLYRNDEEAGFVEIPGALGADDSRHSRSSVWADYDNDGDMDLYVVNGRGERCSLYRNDVDTIGLFTDVTAEMNVGEGGSYVDGGSCVFG